MNSFVFYLLLGGAQQGGAGGTGGAAGGIMSFLPFIAIIAIFYFLIIRPQNKKQKDVQKMLSDLKKGDRIVTLGGIHGTIQTVREKTVIVKVDENTKLEFSRNAVSSVVSSAKDEKDGKEEDKEIESPETEDNKK